ncbi:subtilisin-like protease SBT3 [Malania oleifera]|uniref:subtilisin-like protease SBT3 n=1 Tax=Malania oleifera TaxID=397392 RepID=UPI0025AE076B|nr:subtilisin-like protease SBT3 [Malania oleifera]
MGFAYGSCLSILLALWVPITFHMVQSSSNPAPERSTYIVHMDKSLMPKAFATHRHWYSSTLQSLNATAPQKPYLLYAYDNALHGFSAVLSPAELDTLQKSPGFVSAYRDRKVALHTTHTPEFLALSPSAGLWPASDYGKDVVVGVIDSGVWPESKSFGDAGLTKIPASWRGTCQEGQEFNSSMCNLKLIGARYFNKGLIAADPRINIDTNSARDTNGHGTHTASTAAGNYVEGTSFFGYAKGMAKGVAPRARVAVYKVVWPDEEISGFTSDVVAGIDLAVADGVDVISISLGLEPDRPLYKDPIAIAAFGAMEKGVLVSVAAGNYGPSLATIVNGSPWTLTVAAGTVDRQLAGMLKLGNGLTIVGWTMFPANAAVEYFPVPLVYNKTLSSCNSSVLLAEAPSYAIIICDQTESVINQLYYVAASRVRAAIFISDSPSISELGKFPCPGIVISSKNASTVIKYARTKHNPTASMNFRETILGAKPAPTVASFSSRGPSRSYSGILKPDIMAPGVKVLAAWIPNIPTTPVGSNSYLTSDYNIISGTSMACPHASGVAALLKGAHPKWSPAAIRSAMITTANPFDNTFTPIKENSENFSFASPLAMGAGQVDPNRALDPGLVYDATPQDYINLLCSTGLTKKQLVTIIRSSNHSCSNPSSDLNYPSFIALYSNRSMSTKVKKFQRTVTNVGDGPATYKAEVTPPKKSVVTVTPEKLVFAEMYEKQSYSLTIKYDHDKYGMVSWGSLVWVENQGKRTVRSPIVVSPVVVG